MQAKTRDLAVAKRDRALADRSSVRAGAVRFDATTKESELVDAWLSDVARRRMRVTTFEETSKRLARRGHLRQVAIGDLTVETLTRWQSKLLDRLAPRTVVGTRTSVNQLLKWAVELEVIALNPITKVRAPKVATKTGNVLAPADVARLLEATESHRYGPVDALLFTSGLRVSEALGLSWDDVNAENGRRRFVMYSAATGKAFGPPKTTAHLGTHVGRRSLITAFYTNGVPLDDIRASALAPLPSCSAKSSRSSECTR